MSSQMIFRLPLPQSLPSTLPLPLPQEWPESASGRFYGTKRTLHYSTYITQHYSTYHITVLIVPIVLFPTTHHQQIRYSNKLQMLRVSNPLTISGCNQGSTTVFLPEL